MFENSFSSTYPVSQSAVHALDFTVARTTSAQEPTPISDPAMGFDFELLTIVIVAGFVVTVLAIVISRVYQNRQVSKSFN